MLATCRQLNVSAGLTRVVHINTPGYKLPCFERLVNLRHELSVGVSSLDDLEVTRYDGKVLIDILVCHVRIHACNELTEQQVYFILIGTYVCDPREGRKPVT